MVKSNNITQSYLKSFTLSIRLDYVTHARDEIDALEKFHDDLQEHPE